MALRRQSFKLLPNKTLQESFTFTDICAGIGGMRLAFEALGGKCVFSSEWDKFCQKTYFDNFSDMPHGDLTKIPMGEIPKHDILLAGFPCQPFSHGGSATRRSLNMKSGFEDKSQGKIFFHIARIINKKKPKAVIFENVPRLKSINGGKTFRIIIKTLEKMGYSVFHEVISSETMVPQKRLRLYIIAILGNTNFVFPHLPNLNPQLKNILEKNVHRKYTLPDGTWNWLQKHAKKHALRGNGFGFRFANTMGVACTLSARYYKDGSEILIRQKRRNPRKLTPRECGRLMGFPDDFKVNPSDAQAYRQFGNSVVVPVVYLIGHSMIKNLNQASMSKVSLPVYSFIDKKS